MFCFILVASFLVTNVSSTKIEASDMDRQCTEVRRADHGKEGISVCNRETSTCDGLYWDGKDASKTFVTAAGENHVALGCMQARFRIFKPVLKTIHRLLRVIQCGALATYCTVIWSKSSPALNVLNVALFYYPLGAAVGRSYLRIGGYSFEKLYALPEFKLLKGFASVYGFFSTFMYINEDRRIPGMIVAWMGFPIEWIESALAEMDIRSDQPTTTGEPTTTELSS